VRPSEAVASSGGYPRPVPSHPLGRRLAGLAGLAGGPNPGGCLLVEPKNLRSYKIAVPLDRAVS
jgi:hypothetical protein